MSINLKISEGNSQKFKHKIRKIISIYFLKEAISKMKYFKMKNNY